VVEAVIFDMNGVIIDDERYHQESWKVYCQKHGFSLSEDDFVHRIFGRTEKDTFEYLYQQSLPSDLVKQYSNERVDIVIDLFKPHLTLTTGLGRLLADLHTKHIPMAVATSSRRRYFNFIMDGLQIRSYFSAVVTAEDISKGKPDPEIYRKAAELLHVSPTNCLAFEDSLSGIRAGQAAGMYVVAITTTHTKDELSLANSIITSFNDFSIDSPLFS
jgi:HAD superfamily hydrolase (TIGR01509 family)